MKYIVSFVSFSGLINIDLLCESSSLTSEDADKICARVVVGIQGEHTCACVHACVHMCECTRTCARHKSRVAGLTEHFFRVIINNMKVVQRTRFVAWWGKIPPLVKLV